MKRLPTFLNTPARVVTGMVSIVLVLELLIMLLISYFTDGLPLSVWHIADPIMLAALMVPASYVLIFRPMRNQQVELEQQIVELRRNEQLTALIEAIPDVVFLKDGEGRWLITNEPAKHMFQLHDLPWQGKTEMELADLHPAFRAAHETCLASDEKAWQAGLLVVAEEIVTEEDGRCAIVETRKVPMFGKEGQRKGLVVIGRDITERRRLEDVLVVNEQELRTLIENTPDTIVRYDRDYRRIYVNSAYCVKLEGCAALLDNSPSKERCCSGDKEGCAALRDKSPAVNSDGSCPVIYKTKINDVFATGKNAELELKWPDKDGRELCSHIRLTAERDSAGNVVSVLGVGRDITELNEQRNRIQQMAFYDSLTSLPNRALFIDRLQQMLADVSWHGQLAGVMLLDLDRFKKVNDTLGHPAGDELLREAAARLTCCVRGYDTVARLGGDEFAILLPEIRTGDDLGRVASKIIEEINQPFLLNGVEVFVSCSIGIALYPEDGSEADDLLKYADSAMYFAKRSGRNNFRFYSKDLTVSANEKLTLETDLRRGFARGELELYYQPKVNVDDGFLVGSEALLRWNHPQRGMVPPDKFIPIAEDSGLIVEIGEWVLRCACRVACDLNSPGNPLHKVAINLSARQFQSGDLVKTVRLVLAETGCHAAWIELEITESLLLDEDGDVLEMLAAFREMGITIAIDDFGTGYSSLSYLANFPIDTLKIDRLFISSLSKYGRHSELVKAIISIAKSLGQQVVAEGVETAEQAALLQTYGCQLAQGYFYGKPMPRQIFEDFAAIAAIS